MKITKKTWNRVAVILIVLLVVVTLGKVYIDKKIGGIKIPPRAEPVDEGFPGEHVTFLKLPDGFKAIYFAKGITGARVMEWDSKGRMLVSQTSEGKVSVLEDKNGDGIAESVKVLLDDLDKPHGLSMKCNPVGNPPCHLYVAQHGELSRYAYDSENLIVSQYTKLLDLPKSKTDRHYSRTLMFLGSPHENMLLISIGSSCNVCEEENDMRGKIIAYDIEKKTTMEYAKGLRNAVFMVLNPINGNVFMTEMGRDGLGDDIPPDEVNMLEPARVISEGAPHFGWPLCYGKNIHDGDFDKRNYIRDPCEDMDSSFADLEAHSAPLGLSFIPEEGWPEDLWFDLLVAYHGSWNRTDPTGYKIVKMGIDGKGNAMKTEDFITGWLTPEGEKLGRPADIKAMPGGIIYITDDMNGVVYKVFSTELPR